MHLPLVDTFTPPYEVCDETKPTWEQMTAAGDPNLRIRTLKALIHDAYQAAVHMANVCTDGALSNFIPGALATNPSYQLWRQAMPLTTPPALSHYQVEYPECDFAAATAEIDRVGRLLSPGQRLFHGGLWSGANVMSTTRPFSTSLCPEVALRNAEHKSKAYDAGSIDLMVLTVAQPKTKVFVYRREDSDLGHELEVLFSANASLNLRSRLLIRSDYPVKKNGHPDKAIPIYVLAVDIS